MSDADDDEPIILHATPRQRASRLTGIAAMLAVAVILALCVSAYSVYTLARDRNGWRETARSEEIQNAQLRVTLDQGIAEIACRSRANFVTVQAAAKVMQVFSALGVALAQRLPTDQIRADLDAANAALTAAFEAQDAAIPQAGATTSTCTAKT